MNFIATSITLIIILLMWNITIINNSTIYLIILVSIIFLAFTLSIQYLIKYYLKLKKEKLKKENTRFKSIYQEINSLYAEYFNTEDTNKYFSKDIFKLLDITSELNNEILSGQMKLKTQSLINNSFNLYLINIRTSVRIIKAKNANINLDQLEVLNDQNAFIVENLRLFLNKLILIDYTDKKFESLSKEFVKSITNLDEIKKVRS